MRLSTRVAVAAMAVLFAGKAYGQEINFAGTTSGCFYTGVGACLPTIAGSGLTYTGGGFDDYTDNTGLLPIGGDNYANFGFFGLDATPFDYSGWKFVLSVMFSAPPGVSTLHNATLEGAVEMNGTGGLDVRFGAPVRMTSTDGLTTFDVKINDVGFSQGATDAYVSGSITATPEPATVGLMLTGIGGLIPMIRRRRQPRAE